MPEMRLRDTRGVRVKDLTREFGTGLVRRDFEWMKTDYVLSCFRWLVGRGTGCTWPLCILPSSLLKVQTLVLETEKD